MDKYKTIQRYVISNVLIPNLQQGRTDFTNSADVEAIVYSDYSDESSQENKALFWRLVSKNSWGKGSNTDSPHLTEEEQHFLLQKAAEHPERHATQHAPRGRPPSKIPQYKLNWGADAYRNCQGKTMEEVGSINPGLLKWLYGHRPSSSSSSSSNSSSSSGSSSSHTPFSWDMFSSGRLAADAIAMAVSLDDLAQREVSFGSFTCAWAEGPPRCLGGCRDDDGDDGHEEPGAQEDEDEREERAAAGQGNSWGRLPVEQTQEWKKILAGDKNEYGVSIYNFKSWATASLLPRDRLAEYSQSASTGVATSFQPVVSSFKLRRLHVIDPAQRHGFEMPCAFHGFGCKTRFRRWSLHARRVSGMDEDDACGLAVYNCCSNRREKNRLYKSLKELSSDKKKPLEKVYGVLDARGYGQVQQRHRHPGPAQPVAEPTPAQPMAHSEPLQVLLPHSSARSVLTEEAESSTVPEDQPEPQQTKSQIRDAKRKRLRDRTTGTKSEQDAEIERYGQWLDRKKKKKRKAEADAEE